MNHHNGAPTYSPDDFPREPTFDQSGPFPPLESEETVQKPVRLWRKVLRHAMGNKHKHRKHQHPSHQEVSFDVAPVQQDDVNPKADFQESLPSAGADIPLDISLLL